MSKVGKNIKKVREGRRMTQDDLAEKLFVTRQTVSNWETGRSNPDVDMICKLAEALDTTANMLIYGKEQTETSFGTVVYSKRKVLLTDLILLLIGAVLAVLYRQVVNYEMRIYVRYLTGLFTTGIFPLYWIFFGWNVMQTLGMAGAAKPLVIKHTKEIHRILIFLLIAYGIIVLPWLIEDVYGAVQIWQLRQSAEEWSWTGAALFEYRFGELLMNAAWKLWAFIWKWHFLFLIPGALLWLTRPSGEASGTKSVYKE